MKKLLVILGPTATGKTDIALHLAKKFNGEMLACDSRQVYKGLDIGTGKLPEGALAVKKKRKYWEIGLVKIWLYDVANIKRQYTVWDFVKDASDVIEDITKRGKLPILVGGSGLYIKALLEGLRNLSIPVDKKIRKKLEKLTVEKLQVQLQKLSVVKWEKMNNSDRNNKRRLIRYIELTLMYPYIDKTQNSNVKSQNFNTLKIGLTAPRGVLYARTNSRAHTWIKEGIIEEVKAFLKKGISKKRIKELGLEYRVIVEHLDNRISMEEMIQKMQMKVRQYAKRQITWFKKEKNIFWFNIQDKNYPKKMEKKIAKWYYLIDDSKN